MNNSDPLLNPEGGDGVWRADIEPALDHLMMRILERENVQRAWERVKSNKGAPGSDGMTLDDFPAYAREHWSEIRQSLSRWQLPTAPGAAGGDSQAARQRRAKPRCALCGRPGDPTSHLTSAHRRLFDPDFSESSFGSRPKALCSWSNPAKLRAFDQVRLSIRG